MNLEIESPQDPANYKDSVSKNIAVKRTDSATKLRETLATSLRNCLPLATLLISPCYSFLSCTMGDNNCTYLVRVVMSFNWVNISKVLGAFEIFKTSVSECQESNTFSNFFIDCPSTVNSKWYLLDYNVYTQP